MKKFLLRKSADRSTFQVNDKIVAVYTFEADGPDAIEEAEQFFRSIAEACNVSIDEVEEETEAEIDESDTD